MNVYRILYLSADGSILNTRDVEFTNDDGVIDRTGDDIYPGRIEVWSGKRLVADFPSLAQQSFPPRPESPAPFEHYLQPDLVALHRLPR